MYRTLEQFQAVSFKAEQTAATVFRLVSSAVQVPTVFICTTTLNIKKFYVLPTPLYFRVLCGSQNKQRLFSYTSFSDWFYNRDGVCLLRGTDWVFNNNTYFPLAMSFHQCSVLTVIYMLLLREVQKCEALESSKTPCCGPLYRRDL